MMSSELERVLKVPRLMKHSSVKYNLGAQIQGWVCGVFHEVYSQSALLGFFVLLQKDLHTVHLFEMGPSPKQKSHCVPIVYRYDCLTGQTNFKTKGFSH